MLVYPSICHTSFPFNNLSIYQRISFKFCICFCTINVLFVLGINGQISIIYHRVMALVNVKKMIFLASSFFTICSILMKLHKNDLTDKSFVLAQKVFLRGYLSRPRAIYMYKILNFFLYKIRVQNMCSSSETYSKSPESTKLPVMLKIYPTGVICPCVYKILNKSV